MNNNELKIAMLKRGDTNFSKKIADITGISVSTAIAKMRYGTFKQKEMKKIINHYNLTSDEIQKIFFSEGSVNDDS